jgi:hypothetical protein
MRHESEPRMIVSSVARAPLAEMYPPDGKLPALITDARENPLVCRKTTAGDVLVKAPAFPYVERHILAIPDRIDQAPTPSVVQVPEKLLAETFQTVGEIAAHYAQDPNVLEINTGWNHSPLENKKHVATQVNTLHVHVAGYTKDDLNRTVSVEDIQNRPELRTKEKEPLEGLITTILDHEVFAHVATRSGFNDKFKRVQDGERVTFEMTQGAAGFADPELAATMQEIHTRAAAAYDAIASCFFKRDENDKTQFAETDGDGNRLALLPREDRLTRMGAYLDDRSYLTEGQQQVLRFMANASMPMDALHTVFQARKGEEPLTEDEKYDRNPMMALKGLAYAAVMTGVRKEDGTFTWKFGFDPVVFAPRDMLQASRGTFSHFERQAGAVFPEDARQRMQADEARLVQKLQSTV